MSNALHQALRQAVNDNSRGSQDLNIPHTYLDFSYENSNEIGLTISPYLKIVKKDGTKLFS